jgi:hypothetical protein
MMFTRGFVSSSSAGIEADDAERPAVTGGLSRTDSKPEGAGTLPPAPSVASIQAASSAPPGSRPPRSCREGRARPRLVRGALRSQSVDVGGGFEVPLGLEDHVLSRSPSMRLVVVPGPGYACHLTLKLAALRQTEPHGRE